MNKAYEKGFMDKCAEFGIYPNTACMKKTAAPVAKRVRSTLRRVKSLLTGSHLKRLEAHRGILAEILGKAERNAACTTLTRCGMSDSPRASG